ncbi:hypothetical protein ACFV1N_13725 [Streptosporangium canum]|uniref:hypothetical protein n=1 Tax=Streptosporangium canum TaxID=324952 RepID=UPI00369233E2
MPYNIPSSINNLSPRERSAFELLINGLRNTGISAEFIESPEGQPEKYPSGLTVDGHLKIAKRDYYVDHTVLPAPQSAILPAATREAEKRLTLGLEQVCRAHRSNGILVTVVPQANKKEKSRRLYYKKVLAVAFLATALNRSISSKELWGDGDDDWTSTEIYDFRESRQHVMLAFHNPISVSYSIVDSVWSADRESLGSSTAEAIEKKLENQLARAKTLGIPVALLVDARRSPNPKEPILWFADPLAVSAMLKDVAAKYPDVINHAWLLRDNEGIATVFPHTEGSLL